MAGVKYDGFNKENVGNPFCVKNGLEDVVVVVVSAMVVLEDDVDVESVVIPASGRRGVVRARKVNAVWMVTMNNANFNKKLRR